MADDIQSVQVSAGRDRWVKLTGPSSFLTALVILLLAVVGYLVHFNLQSWGEPIPLEKAFHDTQQTILDHAQNMTQQHDEITLALRWNTFVQWACSPNNVSDGAKRKCSEIDLLRPEPEEQTRRRYRIRPE